MEPLESAALPSASQAVQLNLQSSMSCDSTIYFELSELKASLFPELTYASCTGSELGREAVMKEASGFLIHGSIDRGVGC